MGARAGDGERYQVDARGTEALQVGDHGTQVNYFYRGTWTDGVAPDPLVSMTGAIDSPYRGLSAFGERDAALFFGREQAAAQLLERMSQCLSGIGPSGTDSAGTGLVVVSGVSGAGKSSLLRAGVLPRLRGAGLRAAPEAAWWPCLVLTPGSRPLEELAVRVAPAAGTDASAVLRELAADPVRFALTARQAALARVGTAARDDGPDDRAGQRRVLLVVDQAEQLFTQCDSEAERLAFITGLHAAATGTGGRPPAVLVVLLVRADFEARLADYPQLAAAVQDRYLLTAMTERQLQLAITQPAAKAGSSVDADLVNRLLDEVRTRPGAAGAAPGRGIGAGVLPLLSHALDQAWRGRAGQALTLADYERTGGIEGAVASSAQRAYDRLSTGQQAMAQPVFTRLVATTSDGIDTADRATRAELTEGNDPARAADVEAVLEAFAAERLLTLAADSVEISHEALLTAWPLLRDTWLAQTHADRVTRTRLRATVADWERRSRDPAYLYRGTLLQAATEAAGRTADPARTQPVSPAERDFLRESNRARRRTARSRRTVAVGVAILILAATVTAGVAVTYSKTASRNAGIAAQQSVIALSRQLAFDSLAVADSPQPDGWTARQLAVAAWSVAHTSQASEAMTTLLAQQQQAGTLYVTDGGSLTGGPVDAVTFTPDGKLLATAAGYRDGGGDGADADGVRLWDPATGQPVRSPLPADASLNGVAFSPDGTLLAAQADQGTAVQVWDLATGKPVGPPLHTGTSGPTDAGSSSPTGRVSRVAFSPDDKLLATTDFGGAADVWNLATSKRVWYPLPEGLPTGLVFSPDDKLLASAYANGTVSLQDVATGQRVGSFLAVHAAAVSGLFGVKFSPDGKLLAAADSDGTVRLWDVATGQPVGSPLIADASGGSVDGVAFSPDGELLAAADSNGTVRLWNVATGRPVGSPLIADAGGGSAVAVVFSPDSRLLAVTDSDGTVRLWDMATRRPVGAPLPADTSKVGAVDGVAFSPDGQLLATADSSGDETVRLWDPATGQPVGAPLPAYAFGGLAFSPDGRLLATATDSVTDADHRGTVRLWDPATGQPVGSPVPVDPTGQNNLLYGVAFSPNGKLLAAGDGDGTAVLLDLVTGKRSSLIADASGGSVNGVAFSPDGQLLGTAGDDGTVRLWAVATGQPVGSPLPADTGENGSVNGVAFSPDGKLLASADGDGTVRLWDVATGKPVGSPMITPGTTSETTGAGEVVFSPDGKLLASADTDGTVQLWDPATGKPVGSPLPASVAALNGIMFGLAFSPDGQLLATAGNDGTVQLWRVPLLTDPYKALCADVGAPSRQVWDQYAPGVSYPKICG